MGRFRPIALFFFTFFVVIQVNSQDHCGSSIGSFMRNKAPSLRTGAGGQRVLLYCVQEAIYEAKHGKSRVGGESGYGQRV